MCRKFIKLFTLLAASTLIISSASAGAYTTNAGVTLEGNIYKILDGMVSIIVGDDKFKTPLVDFDEASKAEINAWAKENPLRVDVYTKCDVRAKIMSSALPVLSEDLQSRGIKGRVSVELVLDESGKVISASVYKSTHKVLEAPSLDAVKTWIFKPAKVKGKTVRSRLRVPFKFDTSTLKS